MTLGTNTLASHQMKFSMDSTSGITRGFSRNCLSKTTAGFDNSSEIRQKNIWHSQNAMTKERYDQSHK